MTPGIEQARKAGITHRVHEYKHDSSTESYGAEAAQKLAIPKDKVFKTLVVNLDNKQLGIGVIPVSSMLNMKLIARAAGAKKAKMADPLDVERSTGYVLGGLSPLGQKKRLKTFVDTSAQRNSTIYVSAGRRGLEIELSPSDLVTLVDGEFAPLCQ